MKLTCTITTPEKLVHEGEAHLVVLPASDGEMGILPAHAPMVALLGVGELRLGAESGPTQRFFVRGGFVQVGDNRVTVLATEAEAGSAIDKAEAAAELERLREAMPGEGLPAEKRQEWAERLHAAKVRARIAAAS